MIQITKLNFIFLANGFVSSAYARVIEKTLKTPIGRRKQKKQTEKATNQRAKRKRKRPKTREKKLQDWSFMRRAQWKQSAGALFKCDT